MMRGLTWWPGRFCVFPRRGGGLGVRDLVLFNKALLGKGIWRFALGEDKLGYRVNQGNQTSSRDKPLERHYEGVWGLSLPCCLSVGE